MYLDVKCTLKGQQGMVDFTYPVDLAVEDFPVSWQWFVGHPRGKRLSLAA